jgi:hypothetical protein
LPHSLRRKGINTNKLKEEIEKIIAYLEEPDFGGAGVMKILNFNKKEYVVGELTTLIQKEREEAYKEGNESERWIRGDYTPEMVETVKRKAFEAGFEASGEGWNGEYMPPKAKYNEAMNRMFAEYLSQTKEDKNELH